jgi:hypothetical protein
VHPILNLTTTRWVLRSKLDACFLQDFVTRTIWRAHCPQVQLSINTRWSDTLMDGNKIYSYSFTYHHLLSYHAVGLHGTFTALPRCAVPTNMPKNTPQISRHGPDPHGERVADMDFLWKTQSVENHVSVTPISEVPGWNLDTTARLPQQVFRDIPLAVHANSVSSYTSSLHNKRLTKCTAVNLILR